MVAQPCADTRERKLDDHREDDRLKHLMPRRGHDIEPGSQTSSVAAEAEAIARYRERRSAK